MSIIQIPIIPSDVSLLLNVQTDTSALAASNPVGTEVLSRR
jgi:hypothetical protein